MGVFLQSGNASAWPLSVSGVRWIFLSLLTGQMVFRTEERTALMCRILPFTVQIYSGPGRAEHGLRRMQNGTSEKAREKFFFFVWSSAFHSRCPIDTFYPVHFLAPAKEDSAIFLCRRTPATQKETQV